MEIFFEPDLVHCDGGSDSVEHLRPFFFQDSEFPHIVPAKAGGPARFSIWRRGWARPSGRELKNRDTQRQFLVVGVELVSP